MNAMTDVQLARAGVHAGPHELCYRCDSFEKNCDGTCELCGLTDRIGSCVREWCPYCQRPELSSAYSERCARRTPRDGETKKLPIVGPLADGSHGSRASLGATGTVCTYAIGCGGHVKIGKSRDVRKRLVQLQTGAPLPAVILGHIARDVELEIHRHLATRGVKRTNGEWFEYTDEARHVLSAYGLIKTEAL